LFEQSNINSENLLTAGNYSQKLSIADECVMVARKIVSKYVLRLLNAHANTFLVQRKIEIIERSGISG